MCIKDIVTEVAAIEKEIFSDPWNIESLQDTIKYQYNILYVLWGKDNNICLYRIQKGQDIFSYKKDKGEEKWSISLIQEGTGKELSGEDNMTVIGYVIASQVAGEAELLRIGVCTDKQKKGYGRLLMDFYIKDMWDETERFFLEVRSSNQGAKALYESFGYQSISVRKAYYTNPIEDGIVYELEV